MRALVLLLGLILAALPAQAQEVAIDLGGDGSLTLRAIQLFVIVTLLSLAPALAVTITCFPFMVTVLSILRSAVGLQNSPPNMLIVSLALFLSWFVMAPVFDAAWTQGVEPLLAEEIGVEEAVPLVLAPFRAFMAARVDPDALSALAAAAPALPARPRRRRRPRPRTPRSSSWSRPSCSRRCSARSRSGFSSTFPFC